jgi:DNA-binding NarL/FixJ family response regulator
VIATTTPALATGLAEWLDGAEPGWRVTDVVGDRLALEQRLRDDAALVVASACLDGMLVVATTARGRRPVPLLMLATSLTAQVEAELLRAGAMAVLPVRASREEFLRVAASVIEGRSVASPAALRLLAERPTHTTFTGRQREILLGLARGQSTREIAAELYLTQSTVKTHIGRLAVRLGMSGRRELEEAALNIVSSLGAEPTTS